MMNVHSAILRGGLALLGVLATAALAEPAVTTPSVIAKLRAEAVSRGLPAEIAEAVGFVETGFDSTQIGASGERGLMQVMPQTAAMLGFRGTDEQLADVDANIRYGVRYLAEAWELADHDLCRALTKYRAGHGAEIMTAKSVSYCQRARAYLASLHSPLANGVVIPVSPAQSDSGPPRVSRGAGFWAREQARVRALSAKVETRSALIAAYNAKVEAAGPSRKRRRQLVAELRGRFR